MESFIGENSFISLLGIDGNTGKILDKTVEHTFIERMKLKKSNQIALYLYDVKFHLNC